MPPGHARRVIIAAGRQHRLWLLAGVLGVVLVGLLGAGYAFQAGMLVPAGAGTTPVYTLTPEPTP